MPPAIIAAAVGIAASAAAAAGVIALTTAMVITIAASAAAALLMKTKVPSLGAYNSQQERKQVLRSSSAPQVYIYGRTMTSGLLFFAEEEKGDQEKEWVHLAITLAAHEIDAVETIYLGDEPVGAYGNLVTWELHNNRQTADPFMLQHCQSWKSDMIGKGIAWLRISLKFDQEKFPAGLPNIKIQLRGKKVYDPRTQQTAWSDNAALCILDFYKNVCNVSDAETDVNQFIQAANISDQIVAPNSYKRYTINGAFDLTDAQSSVLDDLHKACAGEPTYMAGRHGLLVGAYYGPATLEIHPGQIVSDVKIVPEAAYNQKLNTVTGTFIDPDQLFTEVDYPPVFVQQYIDEDGFEFTDDLKLRFVSNVYQAQQLAQLKINRTRVGRSLQFTMNLSGYQYRPGYYVKLFLPQLGINGQEFRITEWDFAPNGGVNITLKQETVTVWADAIGKPIDRPDITDFPSATVPQPVNLLYTVTEIGEVVQGILSWTNIGPYSYNIVNVRQNGKSVLSVQVPGNSTPLTGLVRGSYDVGVIAVSALGARSVEAFTQITINAPDAPVSCEVGQGYFEITLKPKLAQIQNVSTQFDFWTSGQNKLPSSDVTTVTTNATRKGIGQSWTGTAEQNDRHYFWYIRSINAFGSSDFLEVDAHFVMEPGQAIEFIDENIRQSDTYKALKSDITELGDDVTSNANAIAKESQDRASAVLAESQARTQGDATVAANAAAELLATYNSVEADIATTNILIQDLSDSVAQQIASVSAGTGEQFDFINIWYFDSNTENWTGTPANPTVVNGYLVPAVGANSTVISPAGLNINKDSYRYLRTRMKKVGKPNWKGVLWYKTASESSFTKSVTVAEPTLWTADGIGTLVIQDIPWNTLTESIDQIKIDFTGTIDANNMFTYDWIAVGRPSPGASQAQLQDVKTAMVSADAAEASQRTTLATQIRGNYEGTDITKVPVGSLFYNETKARQDADSSLSSSVTALSADYNSNKTQVQNSLTALTTGQTSQGTAITDLQSSVTVSDNLIPNPTFANSAAGWGRNNTVSTVDGYPAISNPGAYSPASSKFYVAPGDIIDVSLMTTSPVAVGVIFGLRFDGPNLSNGVVNGPTVNLTAGQKYLYTFSVIVPADATTGYLQAGNRTTGNLTIYNVTATRRDAGTLANSTAITSLTTRVTNVEGTVTSQASSITSLNSSLDTLKKQANPWLDGTFETYAVGSVGPFRISAAGSASIVTDFKQQGSKSAKLTRKDNSSSNGDIYAGDFIACRVSSKWRVECWVLIPSTMQLPTNWLVRFGIISQNSAGAYQWASAFDVNASNLTVRDTWVKFTGIASVDTEGVGVRPFFAVNANAGTLGYSIYVDSYVITDVTDAAAAQDTANAASTAVSSLDTRVTTVEGKVTAQASSITSLQSGFDNLSDLQSKTTIVDLSGLDANTYYAVTFALNPYNKNLYRFRVYRPLWGASWAINPPWSTHNTGGFSISLRWKVLGSGWGANNVERTIDEFQFLWSAQSPVTHLAQMESSSNEYVYLRGGANYAIEHDISLTPVIRTTDFTAYTETISPMPYNSSLVPQTINQKGNANAIATSALDTRVTNAEGKIIAQATSITNLTTSTNNNATNITNEATARTNADSALSSRIDSVKATADGASASVQTLSQTVATTNGKLEAQWGVKVSTSSDVKRVAGIQLGIDATGSSNFLVDAGTFGVYNPNVSGGSVLAFTVSGAQTYIKEAFIQDGTIGTAKIANASISSAKIASQIQSDNFVSGSTGWMINKNGTAQFQDVTVRGTIYATSGEFKGVVQADSFIGDVASVYKYQSSWNFSAAGDDTKTYRYQMSGYAMRLTCEIPVAIRAVNGQTSGRIIATININGNSRTFDLSTGAGASTGIPGSATLVAGHAVDIPASSDLITITVTLSSANILPDKSVIGMTTLMATRINSSPFSGG